MTDRTPYHFRTAGGSADIGNRAIDKIVGGTLCWNQKIRNTAMSTTDHWSHTRCSLSASGGILSAAFNASDSSKMVSARFCVDPSDSTKGIPIKAGHVVLISFDWSASFDANGAASLYYNIASSLTMALSRSAVLASASEMESGAWHSLCSLWVPEEDVTYFNVGTPYNTTGKNVVLSIRNPQVYDLTQMFGATIASHVRSLETATPGAGTAWFRRLFPKARYAYNPGQFLSVNTSARNMVGFNAYNPNTHNAELIGDSRYQITGAYTALSYTDVNGCTETVVPDADGYFTPAKNGTLTVTGGSAATTCVHLVWSGYRDGEWEAYSAHSYALDESLTLLGVAKLDGSGNLYYDGDTYEPNGTVTRRYVYARSNADGKMVRADGAVKDWTVTSFSTNRYVSFPIADTENAVYNGIGFCSMYPVKNLFAASDNDQCVYPYWNSTTTTRFGLRDSTIPGWNEAETGAELIAAVESYLAAQYALGNVLEVIACRKDPVIESADAFADLQAADDFGTEEYVDCAVFLGTRDVAIPVGHETQYPANLRDKLQHLPDPANADGTYLIHQEGGQMALSAYTAPRGVPDAPAADGTYVLKAAVTDGAAVYAWVEEV